MNDIKIIISTISEEIEERLNNIIPNKDQYNLIKNDLKIFPEDPKSLSIMFSTRYFMNPVKISFIQKIIKIILEVMTFENNVINDILIATDEAVSNIIEHSYKTKAGAIISFKMIFSNHKLIIMIDDYGKKGFNFNLYNSGNYKTMKELHETAKKTGGGMGIFLIKKIMDEIKYESVPNQYNRIVLIKRVNSLKLFSDLTVKNIKSPVNYKEDAYIKFIEKISNCVVINIEGCINTDNSLIIDEEIQKIKKNLSVDNFIFDLNNTEYISSSGIEIFMKLLNLKNKKNISLIGINDKIKRVFKLTGFLKYFNLFDSVEKAKKIYK